LKIFHEYTKTYLTQNLKIVKPVHNGIVGSRTKVRCIQVHWFFHVISKIMPIFNVAGFGMLYKDKNLPFQFEFFPIVSLKIKFSNFGHHYTRK
jgi:hypothetical protein